MSSDGGRRSKRSSNGGERRGGKVEVESGGNQIRRGEDRD